MPQTSLIGRPSAAKNSSTSSGVGAAPMTVTRTRSRPSSARIFEKICSSATRQRSARSSGTGSAGLLEPDALAPGGDGAEHRGALRLVGLGGEAGLERRLQLLEDARNAAQTSGRTSGRCAISCFGSGQSVIR